MDDIPATVRRERIARATAERGFLRVTDAATEFGVSGVTIRGDLAALEATGSLVRVHGGATPRSGAGESSFESSLEHHAAAKRAIGRAAAGLVSSGDSVILDVGTTALAVAHALIDRHDLVDVLVVTNGLTIALALEAALPRFIVVVTGGTLRPQQHSLVNPFASPLLEQLTTDIAFIGCNGVDVERGVTNVNLPEAEVKQRMVASTKRAVVVADGSKLGASTLGFVGALDAFDCLITAGDEGGILPLQRAGLEVVKASVG